MSLYYNDYIISSNNSINDNKYNAEKLAKSSASYKIKKILKPIMRMLRQNKKTSSKKSQQQKQLKNTSCESYECDFWGASDCNDDNAANEELERKIINEIQQCSDNSAIYVYNQDNTCDVQPVYREDLYVPVHFARTQAGTFFWTTMQRAEDSFASESTFCTTTYEPADSYNGDRWVQA